ncbi:unnamed protein product [Calypogeia fissa]
MVDDKPSIRLLETGTCRNYHHGSVDKNLRISGNRFYLLLVLLLIPTLSSLFHFCAAEQNTITTDTEALLAFKQFADPSSTVLTGWVNSTTSNPCAWREITCNAKTAKRVIGVNLFGLQLYGTFNTSTLSNLSQLRTLNVSNNNFKGSMPDDLGALPHLEQLWAGNAQFSGSFPNSLANNSKMTRLSLSGNNFSGPIPDLDGNTAMVFLDLSSNGFSGSIPALPPIAVTVSLSNNSLNGSIPSSFVVPTSLMTLDLSNNELSGPIPTFVDKVANVSLDGNTQLCGPPTSNLCPPSPTTTSSNNSPTTLASEVPAPGPVPAPGNHKKKFSTKAIIVLVVVDVVGLTLIVGGLLLYFSNYAIFRKAWASVLTPKEREIPMEPVKPPTPPPAADPQGTAAGAGTAGTGGGMIPESEKAELIFVDEFTHKFELEELLRASAEILGKGSLGTTYKARLDNGHMVAVKRLKDVKEMPKKEFEKKMNTLGQMNHPNLVPLRAYYYTKDEKLLVYDYMYNGSLAAILHGPKDGASEPTVLPWDFRVQVAYDVAMGLNFLHEKCPQQMFPHQNVKSSNVILGNNYEAYLADFCLVPLMPPRIAAQGMTGYAAPEYIRSKKRSEKADIYSYGVLLLELLTGRKPSHASDPDGIDLPKFVKGAVRDEWTVEVFDLQLKTSRDGDAEMVSVLQIAMRCVDEDPEQRPTLAQVLKVLDNMKQSRESYLDRSRSGDLSSATQYDSRELEPDHDSSFSR